MIQFPNAKINLGLNVISKRKDGYHNIETFFLPIKNLYDVIEIVPVSGYSEDDQLSLSGIPIPGNAKDNLCLKALNLMRQHKNIPPLNIFIHKVIPIGSGLGGGSSNAAFMLKIINDLFEIGLNTHDLENIASKIGADCAFFIGNNNIFAEGIGNVFSNVDVILPRMWVEIIVPQIHVSTSFAYQNIIPRRPLIDLKTAINSPVESWREMIINDFELPIFEKYPELKEFKEKLYQNGAFYASMSGSGSAIYGLFKHEPFIQWDKSHFVYSGYI